jgi:hypothetical protein
MLKKHSSGEGFPIVTHVDRTRHTMQKAFQLFVTIVGLGCWSVVSVHSALADESDPSDGSAAPALSDAALLHAGQTLVLRIREVISTDPLGLSPGERVLNSRPPLMAGDRFVAEVMQGAEPSGILLGGTVRRIYAPAMFRRPGHLEIELTQLVQTDDGKTASHAVSIDMKDRRLSTAWKRHLVDLLFAFEGAGVGAAIGDQLGNNNATFIAGGAGIGLVAGLGYVAVQHGPEATLQPGDTFQIVVGDCGYRPLSATPAMTIYAPDLPPRK